MAAEIREIGVTGEAGQRFSDLSTLVARHDGVAAFSEQTLVEVGKGKAGTARLFEASQDGTPVGFAALVREGDVWVLEAAVAPEKRGRGAGKALVTAAAESVAGEPLRAWVHAGSDDTSSAVLSAQALARSLGWEPTRELFKLGLALDDRGGEHVRALAQTHPLPQGLRLTTYSPDLGPAWVKVNAAAFASHPEQGRLGLEDLQARAGSAWFRAEGFFLAQDGTNQLAGFHWTKIPTDQGPEVPGESPEGEVYAVGIDPSWQGKGLGKALTLAGMAYLAEARDDAGRPLQRIVLYVDAENTAALSLYRSLGFRPVTVDRQYAPAP
ncbi:mycothiol synthase [Rothia nasimurium]|uniref:mycothiol synthase n=1 Tax=Rothia nasimurium TaxID=85336 RepID=UPI003B9DE8BD